MFLSATFVAINYIVFQTENQATAKKKQLFNLKVAFPSDNQIHKGLKQVLFAELAPEPAEYFCI